MLSQASQGDIRAFEIAQQQAAAPAEQVAPDPAWWNVVAQFKAAAAGMEQAYARLVSIADYARSRPTLAPRFDALMKRAATVRATVSSIRDQLGAAVDWFRSMGAAVGLSGLGVLPIIGIAAIAAAIALVTKWTTDALTFFRAVDEQRRLEAAGVAPERASEIVRDTLAASQGGALMKWLPLAALLAGGWFLWQATRNRR